MPNSSRHYNITDTTTDINLPPDIMLPEQFADTKRNVHRSPEKQLWLSVLELGLQDARMGPGTTDGAFQRWAKARLWVKDDYDCIGSFVYCCHVLDLNAEHIRKGVLGGQGPISFTRRAVDASLSHDR